MANLSNQLEDKEVEAYVLWHQASEAKSGSIIEKELLARYRKSLEEIETLENRLSQQQ